MSPPSSISDNQILAAGQADAPLSDGVKSHSFLSDELVARGLVSQAAMDAALAASRGGRRYCEILIADGILGEDDAAHAIADHHHVDYVDLDAFPIDPGAKALVPQATARRNGAFPIAVLATGEVVVAIHDPGLANLIELADVTKRAIQVVIASRSQVERYIGAGSESTSKNYRAIRPVPAPVPAPVQVQPAVHGPTAPAPAPVQVQAVHGPMSKPAAPAPVHVPDPAPAAQAHGPALVSVPALPAPEHAQAAGGASAPPAPDSSASMQATARGEGAAISSEPRLVLTAHDHVDVATPGRDESPEPGPDRDDASPPAREPDRVAALEERLAMAQRHAQDADERTRMAERRADGMVAAAQAASDALAQVAQARAVADDEAKAKARIAETLASEMESIRRELDSERSERRRLEAELQRLQAGPTPAVRGPRPTEPDPAPVAAAPDLAPPPPSWPPPTAQIQPPSHVAPPVTPARLPPAVGPAPPPPSGRPPSAAPAGDAPGADSSPKARGLRRMIAALRRS